MADALHSSYAAPVFKRPRLDVCVENVVLESPFDSLSSEEGFRCDYEAQPSAQETISGDSTLDINGGDSGFHDQSPINKGESSSALPSSSLQPVNLAEERFNNEPYSSNLEASSQNSDSKQNQRFDKDSDDNDGEDVASTVSDLSALSSDLSNFSGAEGKPNSGPFNWVQRQMESGIDPRDILMEVLPKDTVIPPNLNQSLLWRIVLSVINEPPQRTKLPDINTMKDVISLLRKSQKIIVLTGAGVSVSCGIPDFRSRDGVYARLSKDYPDLPDPQAMFDINYFRKDPRPFFKFAKEIYPGLFQPSPSHHFIKLIEKQGKLLRNYTQNIDTLEQAAGIQNVITCHGSFATASCTRCQHKVDSSFIKEDIFTQRIPYCPVCPSEGIDRGIMKPDIVFFGEGLSDEFHHSLAKDKEECDLLIVMGSSLKVRPVALIPNSLPSHVPQILINREPLSHVSFDVELLGDCDIITGEICKRLEKDWKIPNITDEPFKEITSLPPVMPPKLNFLGSAAQPPSGDSVNVPQNKQISTPPIEEESNSCDCRGMSAIKLDDSQDGSFGEIPEKATPGSSRLFDDPDDFHDSWSSHLKDSISSRLPDKTFLFIQPNRYVFHGAEVYNDSYRDPGCHSPKNSGYDSESPCVSSDDDELEASLFGQRSSPGKDNSCDDSHDRTRTKTPTPDRDRSDI